MIKKILIIFTLFSLLKANAQDLSPWNTSFVVSAGGYTDTVWFGCDTAGGVGFQEGLDVLDTSNFTKPLKIVMYDSIVQQELGTGTCGNLKRNIRNFKEQKIRNDLNPTGGYFKDSYHVNFSFYVLIDTSKIQMKPILLGTGTVDSLLLFWNDSDFLFSNDSFEITFAGIIQKGVKYLAGQASGEFVFNSIYENRSGDFSFFGGRAFVWTIEGVKECHLQYNKYDLISKMTLYISYNYQEGTQYIIIEGLKGDKKSVGKVYPNPNQGQFIIDLSTAMNGDFIVTDIMGRTVYQKTINYQLKTTIGMYDVKNGLYFLQIYDEQKQLIGVQKISIYK